MALYSLSTDPVGSSPRSEPWVPSSLPLWVLFKSAGNRAIWDFQLLGPCFEFVHHKPSGLHFQCLNLEPEQRKVLTTVSMIILYPEWSISETLGRFTANTPRAGDGSQGESPTATTTEVMSALIWSTRWRDLDNDCTIVEGSSFEDEGAA